MTPIVRSLFVTLIATSCVIQMRTIVHAQDAASRGVQLPITLEGDQRTELRARVEGYVAQVHGDIGDRVTAGQLLVTLDAPELEADVLRRQQMVRQAEANLAVAKGRIAIATAKRRQAISAREEQIALRKLRVSVRDRYEKLVQGGAVQKEMLEEADFNVMAVEAAMTKIEADIESAQADIEASKNEFEYSKSGIEVAKAELASAVAADQLRQIKAPFGGIITDRTVDPGQLVSPGDMSGKPLLVVENVEVMRGVLTVPADEASLIRLGDPVTLIGFGAPEQTVSPDGGALKVSRMSQTLDMKTRTMRVEIDLKNPYDEKNGRYQFLSGQYGSARVTK
ncbi:MAG: efflux RND transporter periplasmic adaptor subunit [Rubripirellula sp.]